MEKWVRYSAAEIYSLSSVEMLTFSSGKGHRVVLTQWRKVGPNCITGIGTEW
jgi:hypothetical protein